MGTLDARAGLAGKTAILIGGAAGIGRAIALALAENGVDIACCDIDEDATRTIVGEVEAHGRKVLSMVADARDVAALDGFYDRVERTFDRVDILINVAGFVKRGSFMDTSRALSAEIIRLNYGYVIESIQRAVPLIRKGGRGGSIVNFTTIEAHRGAATFAVYAGAKAATTNFSRAIAVELAAEGIRVNLIAPDTTPSKTSANSVPDLMAKFATLSAHALEQVYGMYIPQKKAPTEQDVANAALFLVSDLSRTITGTTIHVDGGTMASSGFLDWPFGEGYGPAPLPETVRRLFDSDK